jgi:hypothetical protein
MRGRGGEYEKRRMGEWEKGRVGEKDNGRNSPFEGSRALKICPVVRQLAEKEPACRAGGCT